MKKLILGISVLVLFSACGGGSSSSLGPDDINSPCSCVKVMTAVAGDILDAAGDKSESELRENDAFVAMMEKLEAVEDKCDAYEEEEVIGCDGFEKLMEMIMKMEEKF